MSLGIGSNNLDLFYKMAKSIDTNVNGQGGNNAQNYYPSESKVNGQGINGATGGVSGVNHGTTQQIDGASSTSRYDQYDKFNAPAHASFVEGYDNQIANKLDFFA